MTNGKNDEKRLKTMFTQNRIIGASHLGYPDVHPKQNYGCASFRISGCAPKIKNYGCTSFRISGCAPKIELWGRFFQDIRMCTQNKIMGGALLGYPDVHPKLNYGWSSFRISKCTPKIELLVRLIQDVLPLQNYGCTSLRRYIHNFAELYRVVLISTHNICFCCASPKPHHNHIQIHTPYYSIL